MRHEVFQSEGLVGTAEWGNELCNLEETRMTLPESCEIDSLSLPVVFEDCTPQRTKANTIPSQDKPTRMAFLLRQ
jgi:hypothetical protein